MSKTRCTAHSSAKRYIERPASPKGPVAGRTEIRGTLTRARCPADEFGHSPVSGAREAGVSVTRGVGWVVGGAVGSGVGDAYGFVVG